MIWKRVEYSFLGRMGDLKFLFSENWIERWEKTCGGRVFRRLLRCLRRQEIRITRRVVDFEVEPEIRKTSFKYFSFLSTHPKFLGGIQAVWEENILIGSKMFSLKQRLKAVKKACREINRVGFENIQQRAKETMLNLKSVQERLLTSPTDSLF